MLFSYYTALCCETQATGADLSLTLTQFCALLKTVLLHSLGSMKRYQIIIIIIIIIAL